MPRRRLDVLLTERGLSESREKAQALILAGKVLVDGRPGAKAGQLIQPDAAIVVEQAEPYVSRGGYKLAHALDAFDLSVRDLLAIDVGASTGGFTDVLLQRGARRVYAVDVGRGQLDWRLRTDPRVVVMDHTNARHLQELPERPDVATVDVSFISLRLVVPAIHRLLAEGSTMILLAKPQFEAGRRDVPKGGVIRAIEVHRRVLSDLAAWFTREGLTVRGLTASPIRGAAGNAEFLFWLGPSDGKDFCAGEQVEAVLAAVHRMA